MVPTITVSGPAAALSRCTIPGTLAEMPLTAPLTHVTGSGSPPHAVTSFPPIDTVIRSTSPGWACRNASAASSWVWVS